MTDRVERNRCRRRARFGCRTSDHVLEEIFTSADRELIEIESVRDPKAIVNGICQANIAAALRTLDPAGNKNVVKVIDNSRRAGSSSGSGTCSAGRVVLSNVAGAKCVNKSAGQVEFLCNGPLKEKVEVIDISLRRIIAKEIVSRRTYRASRILRRIVSKTKGIQIEPCLDL